MFKKGGIVPTLITGDRVVALRESLDHFIKPGMLGTVRPLSHNCPFTIEVLFDSHNYDFIWWHDGVVKIEDIEGSWILEYFKARQK